MRFILIVIALFISLAIANAGFAQSRQDAVVSHQKEKANSKTRLQWLKAAEHRVHELSLLGGYGFNSFELWGKTPDATLGQLGIGYNRKLFKLGEQVLEYRMELNVLSKITYPEFAPQQGRRSLSGFGLTPFGIRLNFRQSKSVQPFLGTSGGFMYLDGPFPDERGEKFNYTFRAGLGLEFMVNTGSSFSIGYTYFHISNGDNGEVNPGIDSGFLFASFTFF